MPTIQKPQLGHVSFSWHNQSELFHTELNANRAKILELSGFDREFGGPGNPPSVNEEKEATTFILELTGILSLAAAIKMDGGYKPANKVIATLKSVKEDPSLIFKSGVEPEALAMVAANYQRGEEEPGTFWFDVDQSRNDLPGLDPQLVSQAASTAIESLRSLAHAGRPHDVMLDVLGDKLLLCYRRFNVTVGRRSVAADSNRAQAEDGPFFQFLTLVIGPLNRFLVELPPPYGAKRISASELARRALRSPAKDRFHRVKKYIVSIFRLAPTQFPP